MTGRAERWISSRTLGVGIWVLCALVSADHDSACEIGAVLHPASSSASSEIARITAHDSPIDGRRTRTRSARQEQFR
jgi:hypothetical protein